VLRSGGEWFIFDFEGEPIRSFNQRREKQTALKDVAGMLRSFAYAAAAVELEGAAPGERALACREAFLKGYLGITRGAGLLPEGEENFQVVLEALELERSVYELRYELRSRPDWVRIPARTLLEMGTAS
jgi:predicted trehalose synthase